MDLNSPTRDLHHRRLAAVVSGDAVRLFLNRQIYGVLLHVVIANI